MTFLLKKNNNNKSNDPTIASFASYRNHFGKYII